jgi:glucose-6-phosphate dehydrogenase assembly protein OpcA
MEEAMNKLPSPAEIERQLRRIQGEVSPNEARTSLFNLVVYAQPQQSSLVETAINGLLGKRPARVIHILEGQSETRIDVSARCVEDWEGREVCIQEILISSGPDKGGESPGTWIPLLIKEIPVYIWWLKDLGTRADELISLLEDQGDHLLVDSRTDPDFLLFYRDFLTQGGLNRLPLDDVAWQGLYPLFKLSAQLFNPMENREHLANISQVSLEGGHASEAFFYFAWLRSKLNWKGKWVEFKGALNAQNGQGQPVSCLHLKKHPFSEGFQVVFKTTTGQELSILGKTDGTALLNSGDDKTFTAVYHAATIDEILFKEVDRDSADRLFIEALTTIDR